ncbi:alpha/beta fold hydrolase [Microbispora sp. KK1-11]|uniref:alpha/beta fold hydrolase n=1 Tax=Microbispora sp. KK1-11 TaxID=2053005 RepID=UPI00115B6D19|nr:alpha/beta hydrolase [Microbispora sp. KK1-11]TQS28565.1 alpha/beta hydrolase [Microbispora sp. KK1-11]
MRESVLEVPGARLRHFVRGSGPLLVLVAGGHGDAAVNEALAGHLADRYTVLTYDRRGLSGSTTDAPGPTPATHADDISHLLSALTTEPAHVFGRSMGALISLELTIRHPGQVGVVVAHEPPVIQLLPEPERARAVEDLLGAEETFKAEGAFPALRRFATFAGIDPTDRESDVETRVPGPEQLPNLEFFLTHDAPAVRTHALDLTGLRNSPVRIVPAAGENSGHIWAHRCARLLAEELGIACEMFPGGHNGYVFRPRATAERLHQVLDDQACRTGTPDTCPNKEER